MESQAHSQRAHAKLAPSSAHRWSLCPGSIRMQEGIADSTSSFAAEGTAAHELAAHCLETGDSPVTFLGMHIDIQAKPGRSKFVHIDEEPTGEDAMRFFLVDEEMVDAIDMYADHVDGLMEHEVDPYSTLEEHRVLSVEQKFDMTHIHPEIFGTGDATVLDVDDRHLHVIDLKYGKGVAVDAAENPQLLLYAAGAARRHHNAQIEKLTVHIVQPRAPHALGPIRSYEIDLLSLFEFEYELEKLAKATDDPNAPLKAGDHCQFCKAQPICPANRAATLEGVAAEFGTIDTETTMPPLDDLTPEQEGRILREADMILSRVKAVQERAHQKAMEGKLPAGFKLVAKRANRKWIEGVDLVDELSLFGIKQDDMYQPVKMKSPAMLEPLFPGKNAKQRQEAMAELVVKRSSGTNLVLETDPRPAVNIGAAADFETVE